eukprot:TRINITY_DN3819_c0_g1_i2.p1 TRINITY_DN3819_c0_g1~~TRINITY_DN3819_c0_g1_i2.p1  ORF type:complete len:526 (+),score=53.93 TRINITY_DN3819_c0_g1_i2:39-1616(+)
MLLKFRAGLKTCVRVTVRKDEGMWIYPKRRISISAFKLCSVETPVRVRFAPSPTGELHLGGFRTALYNYLFAKKHGGKFILRIEDTDQNRLVPGAALQLENILDWLRIPPDESPTKGGDFGPYVQSERLNLYKQVVDQMIREGQAYRCFCTEKRLEILRKESAKMRTPNIYDRRCLHLSEAEIAEKLEAGVKHTVRFKLSPLPEGYQDLIYGEVRHDVFALEGDPIIMKSDGYPTYHLANIVDDHYMNISHVLRGAEWQASTPKHVLMYRAMGWTPPQFAHLPLMSNADGSKLSKRQQDLHIRHLREKGYSQEAILNFVTLVGGGFENKEYSLRSIFSIGELLQMFELSKISHASGRIEMERLDDLNNSFIRQRFNNNKDAFLQECKDLLISNTKDLPGDIDLDTNFEGKIEWLLQRITTVGQLTNPEFMFLWNLDTVESMDELNCEKEILSQVIDLLEQADDFKQFQAALKKFCKSNNLKAPRVLKDLRVLITGKSEGPPIGEIYDLMGRENFSSMIKNRLSSL